MNEDFQVDDVVRVTNVYGDTTAIGVGDIETIIRIEHAPWPIVTTGVNPYDGEPEEHCYDSYELELVKRGNS